MVYWCAFYGEKSGIPGEPQKGTISDTPIETPTLKYGKLNEHEVIARVGPGNTMETGNRLH